ncbi:MAG: helix-turn-helix domain-containing protein [Planctomycetota bacterium]
MTTDDIAARYELASWARDLLLGLRPLTPERELAELLGVSTRTLRAWRASGRLSGVQTAPGGRVRYAREHIAALLATMPSARGSA